MTATDMLGDPARLAAVHATGLLDSVPEEAFDRYARLAQRALHADRTMVNLLDADRQFTKACFGPGEGTIPIAAGDSLPAEASYCARVVAADAPIVAADTRVASAFAGIDGPGPDVAPGYIGVPLHAPGGEAIGTICALTTSPHDWSEADLATLSELRDSVETEIALRLALADAESRTRELEERGSGIETLHEALAAAGEDWTAARTSATRMAAHTAHELRTPLAAVRNLAEDLLVGAPSEMRDDLRTMQDTAAEALVLVNEQLDNAGRDIDAPRMRLSTVDVPKMLGSLRGMMAPLCGDKPIELVFLADGVETMRTDGLRLAQILRNLLANAVRLTPRGVVSLSVRRDADDPDMVLLSVCDDGPGIAPADQERIFAPFEQVAEHAAGGTGLGLPISRSFAQLLGGTLEVSSVPGHGACFVLRVPAVLTAGDDAQALRSD